MNMVVIEGIDTARVALAAHLKNLPDHAESIFKTVISVDGQHGTQFLAGKFVFFANFLLLNNDEFAVFRHLKTGLGRYLVGRGGHGFNRPPSFFVPQGSFQHLFFFFRGQISAFGLKLGQKLVIN